MKMRKGTSGTLLFVGSIGSVVLKAAARLLDIGIPVSVASVPFLSNLDKKYLIAAAAKGPIVTIEEHSRRGGFGSALLEFLNAESIHAKVGVVASDQNNLSQIGSQEFLREANGLTDIRIVEKFRFLLEVQYQ